MNLFDTIDKRKSIRSFKATKVEQGKLDQILEAANRAPSAGNLQAYEIYRICDSKLQEEIARAALGQDFITEAPLTLVFCANPERARHKYGQRGESLYSLQDATISCCYAQLAAAAQGLGTVWVGAFDEEAVWRLLGSPSGLRPVAILPIGYDAEKHALTERRSLSDRVHEV